MLSHAEHLAMPRDTPLKKTLFACDELSRLRARVRARAPDRARRARAEVGASKKLKQPSFAAGVHRDEVYAGAELLGLELDEHIRNVVAALQPIAPRARAAHRRGRGAVASSAAAATSRSRSSLARPLAARRAHARPRSRGCSRTTTPRSRRARRRRCRRIAVGAERDERRLVRAASRPRTRGSRAAVAAARGHARGVRSKRHSGRDVERAASPASDAAAIQPGSKRAAPSRGDVTRRRARTTPARSSSAARRAARSGSRDVERAGRVRAAEPLLARDGVEVEPADVDRDRADRLRAVDEHRQAGLLAAARARGSTARSSRGRARRASSRVRGVTSAEDRVERLAGRPLDDARRARARRTCSGPSRPKCSASVVTISSSGPRPSPASDDVAAVGRRARQRDVLRRRRRAARRARARRAARAARASRSKYALAAAAVARGRRRAAPRSRRAVGRASGPNVPAFRYASARAPGTARGPPRSVIATVTSTGAWSESTRAVEPPRSSGQRGERRGRQRRARARGRSRGRAARTPLAAGQRRATASARTVEVAGEHARLVRSRERVDEHVAARRTSASAIRSSGGSSSRAGWRRRASVRRRPHGLADAPLLRPASRASGRAEPARLRGGSARVQHERRRSSTQARRERGSRSPGP